MPRQYTPTGRPVGRPKMPNARQAVSFRLPQQLAQRLSSYRQREGTPLAAVIQGALASVFTIQAAPLIACMQAMAQYAIPSSEPYTVRLEQGDIHRAQAYAKRHGLTLSDLLRVGLEVHLRDVSLPPTSPERERLLQELREAWEAREGPVDQERRALRTQQEADYEQARAALLTHYEAAQDVGVRGTPTLP
jgi:hypothetical protein